MSNISMQSLVRIHNKLKMKYENKQCSKPQVGIFATDSDSVPDSQQIYNRFLVDHKFKIGCNSVINLQKCDKYDFNVFYITLLCP